MPSPSASTRARTGPMAVPGLRTADTGALMQSARGPPGLDARPTHRVLDGRHVAVLALAEHDPSAEVFAAAAQALGAHVAHVSLGALNDADTARLLGRLYAAVGCAGLDLGRVAFLQRTCGVPVLHDLAAETHPTRLLADAMTLTQALHEAAALLPLATPTARPRLGVYGPPRSALLRAWKRIAAGLGLEVIDLSAPDADARAAGCHFACRPGVPPEMLLIGLARSAAVRSEASLAERQRSNHGQVVQALLRNALGLPS